MLCREYVVNLHFDLRLLLQGFLITTRKQAMKYSSIS